MIAKTLVYWLQAACGLVVFYIIVLMLVRLMGPS